MTKRASILLLFSTGSILLLLYSHVPMYILQQAIILLFASVLFVIVGLAIPSAQHMILKRGKWFIFFLAVLLVQLLLVTTGGLSSPYLVAINLLFLGICFIFSFGIALLFLVSTLLLLAIQAFIDPFLFSIFMQNIGVAVLYATSFITIIPIAYVLTKQYKIKDTISKTLTQQIKIEESILTDVKELILVADAKGKILSLNDAVERILHKSRSELLQSSLFAVLLMKDEKGVLLNDTVLFQEKSPRTKGISLLTSSGMIKANMTIKPIESIEGEAEQVSIIISILGSDAQRAAGSLSVLQEAIAKHDAMLEGLKSTFESRGEKDIKNRVIMLIKAEGDIKTVRDLEDPIREKKIPIDLAALCRQTVIKQGDYTNAFGVMADFSFVDFSEKDITSFSAGHEAISPDQITGPFFTAPCDVKYTGILLQKLLDISALIAAREKEKIVRLTIERMGENDLLLKVMCRNSIFTADDLQTLFKPYYGELAEKTDLRYGSGLEGFIAREISNQLRIPLQVNLTKDNTRLVFMLIISKGQKSLSSLASKQKNSN